MAILTKLGTDPVGSLASAGQALETILAQNSAGRVAGGGVVAAQSSEGSGAAPPPPPPPPPPKPARVLAPDAATCL